ncbi:MAG: alginate lyase family protein, partial [Myxococcales bacterium]|nr:alginate lyase family protein [Myxococcales bacterium]
MSRVPGAVPEVRCAASTGKNYIAAHPELGLSEVGCAEQLDDSAAAYGHALAWYYGGDRAHAQKAVEILNAWSGTLTKIFFDQPRTDMNVQIFANGLHQSGWSGQNFSRAAEIIRHTFNAEAGETAFDAAGFEKMLRDVYLPLTMAGGAGRGSWNGFGVNVNFSMIDATIGIGVFLSDTAVYESGLTTFREHLPSAIYMEGDDTSAYANLAGMPIPPKGTIYDKTNVSASSIAGIWNNPSTFIDGVEGETCRDMSHMAMGFGGMANAAETARLQGADLYGEFQSRLLASLELNAAFINAADAAEALPENWPCPGAINMGGTGYRVGWEIEFNHFAQREGIEMPHVSALVARYRPSGTGLHMNWETLTHAGVP